MFCGINCRRSCSFYTALPCVWWLLPTSTHTGTLCNFVRSIYYANSLHNYYYARWGIHLGLKAQNRKLFGTGSGCTGQTEWSDVLWVTLWNSIRCFPWRNQVSPVHPHWQTVCCAKQGWKVWRVWVMLLSHDSHPRVSNLRMVLGVLWCVCVCACVCVRVCECVCVCVCVCVSEYISVIQWSSLITSQAECSTSIFKYFPL